MRSLLLVLALVIGWATYLELEVKYWDARIDKLCRVEGGRNVGLRVYEVTNAPQSYFLEASPGFPERARVPTQVKGAVPKANGPIVERTEVLEILSPANPFVARISVQLFRVADATVLAEDISYIRQGGGVPLVDIPGSYGCPKPTGSPDELLLYRKTFANHPRHIK